MSMTYHCPFHWWKEDPPAKCDCRHAIYVEEDIDGKMYCECCGGDLFGDRDALPSVR